MTRFSRFARCTAFVAVWALLLQAATPMLAAWAAQRQGVAVAEVCEVHGVAMPGAASHAAPEDDKDRSPPARHGSGHCALLALGAVAPPAAGALSVAASAAPLPPVALAAAATPRRDDFARWIARLHHGPPGAA